MNQFNNQDDINNDSNEISGQASQADIDALFDSLVPKEAVAKRKKSTTSLNLKGLFAEQNNKEKEQKQDDDNEQVSQNDIDELFSSINEDFGSEKNTEQNIEENKKNVNENKKDVKEETSVITNQDDIDALFASINEGLEKEENKIEENSNEKNDQIIQNENKDLKKKEETSKSARAINSLLEEIDTQIKQEEDNSEEKHQDEISHDDFNSLIDDIIKTDSDEKEESSNISENNVQEIVSDERDSIQNNKIEKDNKKKEVEYEEENVLENISEEKQENIPLEQDEVLAINNDLEKTLDEKPTPPKKTEAINITENTEKIVDSPKKIIEKNIKNTIEKETITLPKIENYAANLQNTMGLLNTTSEIEGMVGQIVSVLGQLSEKTRAYMQMWVTSDQELKIRRNKNVALEQKIAQVEEEINVLTEEITLLRKKNAVLEGERLGWEESKKNLENAQKIRYREQESQIDLLNGEIKTLKEEIARARNQASATDVEARRNRFETDRLKNELEAEKMERLRIQRALDNREKEIQAIQAQSTGQASSLFIDELHRLVRRLENELEAKTAGAYEALTILDKLKLEEEMVPVEANLRAALLRAVGEDNSDDALKNLTREIGKIPGAKAVEPINVDLTSFETAISTYKFEEALDIAGNLLREAKTTPNALMKKIYISPPLRKPEIAEYLVDIARLLEGIRTIQESADRTRGKETNDSEKLYVQMFDYLHNLVRLKIINRMTGDAWRLFMDLRGKFSFVTSDKQWADYRDNVLGNK